MSNIKGLYAECIRLEEKLFKFIEQDLLSIRLVNYVYVITQCKHMLEVNKANYIYKEFTLADLNGDDWRTNKHISHNIDNIINDGTRFNADMKKLLENYLRDWDSNTKLLEKYIDQIFINAIKDTINSDKPAEDILHDLERLEKILSANKNDIVSLYMKTTKDIRLLGESFVDNVLHTSYRYIKEKEKEIFVWRTDDESWWNTALDANIVSLASELSPNGKHMKLNTIINGGLISKLAAAEFEFNRQSISISKNKTTIQFNKQPSNTLGNGKEIRLGNQNKVDKAIDLHDTLMEKLEIASELFIMVTKLEIKWGYIFNLALKNSVSNSPLRQSLLLAKIDLEEYCEQEKEAIKKIVTEQDEKEISRRYAVLDTVMSTLLLSANSTNPLGWLFAVNLVIKVFNKRVKEQTILLKKLQKPTNPSIVDIYVFMTQIDAAEGFIKLPSKAKYRYYSLTEVLSDKSLKETMLKRYNKIT